MLCHSVFWCKYAYIPIGRTLCAVSAIAASRTQASILEALESNAVIARGLKKQDPQLLDLLIEQYQHRLLRYLLFLTGKRDLAEDLFQETWMRVLTRGAQYDGRARFDTWLFTIARNLVIDNSRKRRLASLDEMTENSEDAQALRSPATSRLPSTICAPENRPRTSAPCFSNWTPPIARCSRSAFTKSSRWKRSPASHTRRSPP